MACSHHCPVYKHHGSLPWLEHNYSARTVPISCAVTTMTWHLAPFLCPHGKITLSLLCYLRLGKECSWQPCGHQCHIAWAHSQPAGHWDLAQHRSRTQTSTPKWVAYCCCKLLLEYCNQPQVIFVRVEVIGGSQVSSQHQGGCRASGSWIQMVGICPIRFPLPSAELQGKLFSLLSCSTCYREE